MTSHTVSYRRPLNQAQLCIVEWLARYRFSTARQLAMRLGKQDHKSIQKRLQILEEQGILGKRYGREYKRAGRAAEYYLTAHGARRLSASHPLAVKALYKNKTVSEAYVAHCLRIADIALTLHTLYGRTIHTYTNMDTKGYDYFPHWLPDLMLYLHNEGRELHAFLDFWESSKPFFVRVRKIRNYLAYLDEGNWPDTFKSLPIILTICDTTRNQRRLNYQIRKALREQFIDNQMYVTTTVQEYTSCSQPSQEIWQVIHAEGNFERTSLISLMYPILSN